MMEFKLLMLAAVAFAVVLANCSRAVAGDEKYDFSQVDARIQQWIDAKNYPAAGIWVVDRDGRTLHERYWNGCTRQTPVMIASASKWLEAATMMTLVDDHKFDLDQPISTYLPELSGPHGRNTLRQMFSHTSSMNDVDGLDNDQPIETLPQRLAETKLKTEPGAKFQYGGTALAVGFRAVEVQTQQRWLTYFGRRIAKPLGMKQTVTGHDLWTYSGIVGGDLYPVSSAADYMRFVRMLLNEGVLDGKRVLSADAVRAMEADQIGAAVVTRPEYPEKSLGQTHHGLYGLGNWRLIVDHEDVAQVCSSPSFAGFIPWIDRRHGIAAVFVGRSSGGIDAFVASADLIRLTDVALGGSK